MMQMWFYFSSTYQDFLFKGVNVNTTWGMLSLCLGLMSLALLIEGLRVGRSHLFKLARQPRGCEKKEYKQRVQYHILQTILQVLQFGITYITMLSVMTYNAYFMIAIVGGSGLGYYFFAGLDFPNRVLGVTQPSCKKGRDTAASEDTTFRKGYVEYAKLSQNDNMFESTKNSQLHMTTSDSYSKEKYSDETDTL